MTAAVLAPVVREGVPEAEYHGDTTSLSSSGARRLLAPSTPAQFRYEQLHGRPPKRAFDFGHAAHRYVLGAGAEITSLPFDNFLTKAAKAARDDAYAAGTVPLLASEVEKAREMERRVREHPIAGRLLESGTPEVSLWATDPETGVRLRARPDWLTTLRGGRLCIVDYKTSRSAHPASFARSAADYGYYSQHPWYCDVAALAGLGDAAFLFVVQEKTAPYAVSVVELDVEAVRLGRARNRRAIDTYARCIETDTWPGWDDEIHLVSLPSWAFYQQEGPNG